MAERIESPTVTVPAGTLSTAPLTTALTWQDGRAVRVEVKIPPGPSGLLGFAIGHSGTVLIPRTAGQWIVADDESLDWDLAGYPTGSKWFVRAYNNDIYDHTLYFRWHIDELSTLVPQTVAPLVITPFAESVVGG